MIDHLWSTYRNDEEDKLHRNYDSFTFKNVDSFKKYMEKVKHTNFDKVEFSILNLHEPSKDDAPGMRRSYHSISIN